MRNVFLWGVVCLAVVSFHGSGLAQTKAATPPKPPPGFSLADESGRPVLGKRPESANFDTYEAFTEALIEWKISQRVVVTGKQIIVGFEPLQKQIDALTRQLEETTVKVATLEFEIDQKSDYQTNARIDPSGTINYFRLDTEAGSFLVLLNKMEPYLDGYKAFLSIASLSGAVYEGFKLQVMWYPKDIKRYREIQNKEQTFTQSILPSRWNHFEIILPQTKADQVGWINVGIKVSALTFSGR